MTREDLSPGYQICQSLQSAIDFILKHPDIAKKWHVNSNYLACLSVKTENDLLSLCDKLAFNNILFTKFHESDINSQLTSICIEPTDEARRITSSLPLALKSFSNQGINKNNQNMISVYN